MFHNSHSLKIVLAGVGLSAILLIQNCQKSVSDLFEGVEV